MSQRKLQPEILDSLPSYHPDALRSRRDLRLIHFLMGNERWMLSKSKSMLHQAPCVFIEIGAGDGAFSKRLAECYPNSPIFAYDLQPPPAHLPKNITWHTGDIRNAIPPQRSKKTTVILLCSMFLHHFDDSDLTIFRPWLDQCDAAIIVEPLRKKSVRFLGKLLFPLCNCVTQHDMQVSIEAGFLGDDLVQSLKLGSRWKSQVSHNWRGAYRLTLQRHETD